MALLDKTDLTTMKLFFETPLPTDFNVPSDFFRGKLSTLGMECAFSCKADYSPSIVQKINNVIQDAAVTKLVPEYYKLTWHPEWKIAGGQDLGSQADSTPSTLKK